MFRASSCPSSGEQYKADNAYGVQHWPSCSRLEEKRWFGVYFLGLVSPIITPIIRRTVQSLAVLRQTRGEEVVRCALVGIVFTSRLFVKPMMAKMKSETC
jgi:glycerol kinase